MARNPAARRFVVARLIAIGLCAGSILAESSKRGY
jgi:hypothetical protein